jgi:hypothetical protein
VDQYLFAGEARQTLEFTEYYEAAAKFCLFLEGNSCADTADFLTSMRTHLLRLYVAALAMPWVDLQSNAEFEEQLSADAFHAVLHGVAEQLGKARYYWHVFDPVSDLDTVPVCGDLLDDAGDIYKDLKYSLMIFNLDKEECEEIALWQLKSDFDAHWNRHCINALSAIHFYLKQLK